MIIPRLRSAMIHHRIVAAARPALLAEAACRLCISSSDISQLPRHTFIFTLASGRCPLEQYGFGQYADTRARDRAGRRQRDAPLSLDQGAGETRRTVRRKVPDHRLCPE